MLEFTLEQARGLGALELNIVASDRDADRPANMLFDKLGIRESGRFQVRGRYCGIYSNIYRKILF